MSAKETVIDRLQRLPPDVYPQGIAREIEFVAGVRKGFEQLDRGEGVSLEEVRKMLPKWAGK